MEDLMSVVDNSVALVEKASVRERKKLSESNALKLLPKIIEAAAWGQQERVEVIGCEIAREIETGYPVIAGKILKQCKSLMRPKKLVHRPESLMDFCEAKHGLDAVILPDSVERECRAILKEHERSEELARFKLLPRHKILLSGPPGNGKTLLAEGLAKELSLPFLPVKYAGLIESYLGSTGKNLQNIFDYAETAPCLLFMDEFDGVAIDRGDSKDVGEIRRVTNQLLILLERLPSTCVFVAATNASELLDRAIHRRFDYLVDLPAPNNELRLRCAQRELSAEMTAGRDLSCHAKSIAELPLENLSAVVDLCKRIRREYALNDGRDALRIIANAA
jgi:hypothetical protein